jgi:HSP20 family protein
MTKLTTGRASSTDLFRREMDRLFTDFFPARAEQDGTNDAPSWAPRADVVETEDAYVLSMDLPGVTADAVDVQFADGTLRVSGRREVDSDHKDGRFHRIERHYGQFFRAFRLGTDIDPDRVDATFRDGVLTVSVPKSEARKPRQITVRAETSVPEDATELEVSDN